MCVNKAPDLSVGNASRNDIADSQIPVLCDIDYRSCGQQTNQLKAAVAVMQAAVAVMQAAVAVMQAAVAVMLLFQRCLTRRPFTPIAHWVIGIVI